ncbi:uncharacterized protein LOC121730680 [Aricia agestis]|uniref:uncharacterized protein LOC121730680 n=1 Tax=Aricia agestis TaxID=91739 RepID=UPI001C203DDB|nr:uncharacterized protein LOC121730680 [Aricia agestis]
MIGSTVTKTELEQLQFDAESQYETTEDIYLEFKGLLKDYLLEFSKGQGQPQSNNSMQSLLATNDGETTPIRTKLPPLSIPKFDGNYNDWISFKDLFKALVHDNLHLTTIEKHHYLKTSLSGEAEQLLKHFALTEANYDKAWSTLESRYNNKRMIVTTIISRLLNQKKMNTECFKSLKEILDTTKECLNSLDNLGVDTSTWDAIIVHLVVSKLDLETHKQWEQSLGSSQDIPTFTILSSFLENRFRSMEMVNVTHKKDQPQKKDIVKNYTTQRPTNIKSFVTEVSTKCTYCSQNHYICHCKEFTALNVPQRQDFIKKNGICFNCLVKGHSVNACRQSTTCRKCSRRHHTLLHFTNPNKITSEPESDAALHNPETSQSTSTVAYKVEVDNNSEEVILATARIAVKSRNGDTMILRALIDPCSQSNFVTEAAAQLLNLERTSVSGKITGISSIPLTTKSQVTLNFHAIRDPPHMITAKAYVLRRINSRLPSQELPSDTWPSSEISDLADPHFHKPASIDVLLGAVVYSHIILDGIIKRNESLIALNSRLGWLVSGEVTQSGHKSHKVAVMHTQVEVDQLLRQFWEINEYSPNVKPLSKSEIQCEEHFKITHTRNTDGRYELRLPFKDEGAPNLGNSRQLALKRLHQMENKFKRRPKFHEEYCKFMRQYESLGHMEVVPETEKQNRAYYLPHHAVLRESSLTTKLRVVFDGSAKPVNGNSLNDELLIGPPLQQDIRDLVTRWRQHKYCLVADIQQMYRQILISKQDTDYQRILWRESSEDLIKEYRLLTVTYGSSCAPYLAIRTLHQLADDERREFPEAELLKTDLYMDDLMTGSSTEEETQLLQRRLTELFKRGGFLLHKWSSNSDAVLNEIPDSQKALKSSVNIKMDDSVKALGIAWKPQSDVFELVVNLSHDNDVVTKRSVLSAMAKTFDPLGWLAPCVVVFKMFMQKLWLAGLDWDSELPEDLKTEWQNYLTNFEHMQSIQLPRWLGIANNVKIELHGFCDASSAAYAAVIYIRVITDNEIKVRLVAAKTKVAPVKQISLPRLELCAAVLLSKLIPSVKSSLNIDDNSVFAWTDSTIVLAWLRKTPNTWKPFVGNRTTEILNVTNSSQWHHIKSADNPSDCASRGISPAELKQSQLWWKGPTFLRESVEICYPNFTIPETTLEAKPRAKSVYFESEIELLSQGKPIPKNSKLLPLNPILDSEKIIRVGGRLVNAQIPPDMKSPIILHHKCASKELDLAFKNSKSTVVDEIAQLLANDSTTWHFIPPGAPHFGGLWEAGVKSVKGHLKRVVGESCLTFEEFGTLITQVEVNGFWDELWRSIREQTV